MKTNLLRSLLAGAVVLAAALQTLGASGAPGKLYAIGGFDPDDTGAVPHRIYEINPLTGQATPLPGSFGPEPGALAATADGRILAMDLAHSHGAEPEPEESTLLEIHPYNGFLTKLATVPVQATGFDIFPDGRAFTIPLPGGTAPVQLHGVNLATGAATPIGGASAIDDAFATAFGSAPAANKRATQLGSVSNHVYAIVRHGTIANLVRFDPATGAATVIGASNAVNTANGGAYRGIPGLSGRDSDGDGVLDELYGVLNYHDHDGDPGTYFQVIGALVKFDLNSGVWSIVGTNPGLLFSGLASTQALNPASAPEPLAFTFETFDLPGASETLLSDIRNDGTLVGRYKDGGGISQGFVQSGTNLTTFNVTGTTATFAGGIDSFGRIAGFYRDAVNPDVQHGFIRQTNGTFTTIDGPGSTTTYAWRINDAGQVNGYWFEDPFFITSFRLATNGALTTNVFAGSPVGTVTRGMNEAGDTAGWKWDESFTLQGVIFADGATNVFTVPGWENTLPGDINSLGDIAGTVNNGFTNTAGFFRRANGDTVIFTPPGAVETEVFGLNDLGQVVGEYADAGGARHGFIACPAVALERGHTDVGIAYENGEFNLHIHDEETDTEYTPKDAALIIGGAAEQPIPDTASLSFLGQPGRSTWILPAVQNTNLLFLGFGAEEIESGVFVGDVLRMELVSVVGSGDFAVFAYDGFSNPLIFMNSADGISAADYFPLVAGGHTDLNWAFSAPGTYRIGFRVRATQVAGNRAVESAVAYYTFVVPQPVLPQPTEPEDAAYTYTPVKVPGASYTHAFGINGAGRIVGRFGDGAIGRGYVREPDGTTTVLNYPGSTFTEAFGINESGFIVGWYKSATATNGFILGTNGAYASIATPGSSSTFALGINAAGLTTGAFKDAAGVQHGFVRDAAGSFTIFDPPGSEFTEAYGINDAGTVVGYFADATGEHGFVRETNGVFIIHDVPGAEGSGILGLNNAGAWSGFFENEAGIHGYVRGPAGDVTPLDFPGTAFTVALGMSDSGVVVGYYADASEVVHGFIATPATRLTRGHTDIGIAFEDGAFDLHVHAEDTDAEYTPGAALLTLPPLTQTIVPTNAGYAFLGAIGSPAWVLPPVQNPKLLFLGFGAEEIESGVFARNLVTMKLKAVDGPGAFSVFSIDGFGVPVVHMNSGDGINTNDVKTIVTGSHEDFAWGFTRPGYYRVTFEACGTLVAGNEFTSSGDVTYYFEVIGIETQLAIARSGGDVTISFLTQDGLTYQLEAAPAITGPWTDEGAAFLGTGRAKQITVPLSPGAQFFKMKTSVGN